MQKFRVTIEVTINTLEDCPIEDVKEEIQETLDEFCGGTATVTEIVEK